MSIHMSTHAHTHTHTHVCTHVNPYLCICISAQDRTLRPRCVWTCVWPTYRDVCMPGTCTMCRAYVQRCVYARYLHKCARQNSVAATIASSARHTSYNTYMTFPKCDSPRTYFQRGSAVTMTVVIDERKNHCNGRNCGDDGLIGHNSDGYNCLIGHNSDGKGAKIFNGHSRIWHLHYAHLAHYHMP